MQKNIHVTQDDLAKLGISSEEIEEAGGLEALSHILWFFQQPNFYSDVDIDNAIIQAIEKRRQEDILQTAFDDLDNISVSDDCDNHYTLTEHKPTTSLSPHMKICITSPLELAFEDTQSDTQSDTLATVKQIYEKYWGVKPHPALKLLLEAYFLDIQDIIPDNDDKKEIYKTVSLLRAYIAGADLPDDAEDEHLIIYARTMYKEFLEARSDYNNCPLFFLLDDYYDTLPEKYRMIAKSLPVAGILKVFADNCFYDAETNMVDEPLPEEINIKNLCEMIETLARIYKIWQ